MSATNATLTNINSTGITTLGVTTATGLTAQNLNISGLSTFTGNVTLGGELRGPALFVIDPITVGDNTGAVRIRGDLIVDGTTTQINSTTIELADFNVGIATTVGTNVLLDGAGIGIGSTNIRKTLTYSSGSDSLKSSENFDLASTKVYKINGTEVLSSSQLTITNISATGVSTLGITSTTNLTTQQLNVSGLSTHVGVSTFQSGLFGASGSFTGIVTAGTFVGQINAGVGTITTFTSTNAGLTNINSSGISTLTTAGVTNLTTQQLSVSGLSTHIGISTFQSGLFGASGSFTGIVTAATFVGQINAGVGTITTFTSTNATITNINSSGIVTAGTFTGQINAGVGTITTFTSTNAGLTNINSSGISTLGVTSATSLTAQNLNISGLSTFVGVSTFQ
jgi:hypothetical protein